MKCVKNTQNNSVIWEEAMVLKVTENIPINMTLREKDMALSRMRASTSLRVVIKNPLKKLHIKIPMTKTPSETRCMSSGKRRTRTTPKNNTRSSARNRRIRRNMDHTVINIIIIKKRISIDSINKDRNREDSGIREIPNIMVSLPLLIKLSYRCLSVSLVFLLLRF